MATTPNTPELTAEQARDLLRYEPDTGRLFWKERPANLFATERSWKTWNKRYAHREAFTSRNVNGYRHGSIFDESISAHKLAWFLAVGRWPNGHIDHINGVRDDNRIVNLREVQPIQNAWNMYRRHDNKSGQTGVIYSGRQKRWCANIRIAGTRFNLGSYMTKQEAVAARKAAEKVAGFHANHGRASSGRTLDEGIRGQALKAP